MNVLRERFDAERRDRENVLAGQSPRGKLKGIGAFSPRVMVCVCFSRIK